MTLPPDSDEIAEMRADRHRLIDRLPPEALVALWRLVWLRADAPQQGPKRPVAPGKSP